MIERSFTEGARRALNLARTLAQDWGDHDAQPGHLLWALMSEESLAFEVLARHGLTQTVVTPATVLIRECPLPESASTGEIVDRLSREVGAVFAGVTGNSDPKPSDAWREVLLVASQKARQAGRASEIGTVQLLAALVEVASPVRDMLRERGVDLTGVAADGGESRSQPVAAPFQIEWRDPLEADRVTTFRILDAAANRAREGLRVVEDYVRFTLDDGCLSRELKELRHQLSTALQALDEEQLIAARDTQGDVGTVIHTASEMSRGSPLDVARANSKRVEEALRTLEEFAKVAASFDPSDMRLRELAGQLGQARYRLYTIEKALLMTLDSQRRLMNANLYLLLTRSLCRLPFETVLREAIAGGVRVVQVREKEMSDRDLLEHARRVRAITAETETLFIMNDRPDLAVLAEADGVHVGQEEFSVADTRRIVGPRRLIGVSTHGIEQAQAAVLDGANYLGIGPVFVSGTKAFSDFAGLEYVSAASREIALPAFAIGGIDVSNIGLVIQEGARRVAVSGAICRSEDPRGVARRLHEFLTNPT